MPRLVLKSTLKRPTGGAGPLLLTQSSLNVQWKHRWFIKISSQKFIFKAAICREKVAICREKLRLVEVYCRPIDSILS